jgi:hypothetical protein
MLLGPLPSLKLTVAVVLLFRALIVIVSARAGDPIARARQAMERNFIGGFYDGPARSAVRTLNPASAAALAA